MRSCQTVRSSSTSGIGSTPSPGPVGTAIRPSCEHERLGDVLGEEPVGRAGVAGQGEPGQRRQREVRGPAEPGLDHAAAPHRDPAARGTGRGSPSPRGSRRPGPALMLTISQAPYSIADSAVATETIDSSRQIGVVIRSASNRVPEQVVLVQRLLDQQQVEVVEPGEVLDGVAAVRLVRVHLQRDVGPTVPARPQRLDVPARLDLQLDPPVARVDVPLDLVQQRLDRSSAGMPTDTPQSTSVARRRRGTPPSDCPAARSWASSTAISRAPRAIGWPANRSQQRRYVAGASSSPAA